MRKNIARWTLAPALLMAAMLCGCPYKYEKTPVPYKSLNTEQDDKHYYLYVPSTYDPAKKYPLMITCHGTPPWDPDLLQIQEWKGPAERHEFIVAAPSLKSTQGILPVITSIWVNDLKSDAKTILTVRDEIIKNYNINTDKILLTGFSAGGYPMYYTGVQYPDKFNMLIARSTNDPSKALDQVDMSIYEDGKAKRLPVHIMIGKNDYGLYDSHWDAFRWLRRHGWTEENTFRHRFKGGHLRKPEITYSHWGPGKPQ